MYEYHEKIWPANFSFIEKAVFGFYHMNYYQNALNIHKKSNWCYNVEQHTLHLTYSKMTQFFLPNYFNIREIEVDYVCISWSVMEVNLKFNTVFTCPFLP